MVLTGATTSAVTQAAYVTLSDLPERKSKKNAAEAAQRVARLRNRGYNTLVVPLMEEGKLTVAIRSRRGNAGPPVFEGPGIAAIEHALNLARTSVWVYVDPLSAGVPKATELGPLALQRREWLVRNSNGHTSPLGNQIIPDPLFSWLNRDYRRFLGDLLYSIGESFPISGILVDLRRYPGISDECGRWYCCSFQSQEVAERELGLSFERLLAEGGEKEVRAWQRLVVSELRHFVLYLASRLQPVRTDLSWKYMVPRPSQPEETEAPWLEWLADGVFDELLLPASTEEYDLDESITRLSGLGGAPRPIMPFFHDEQDVLADAEALEWLPVPGFLVLNPGTDPETQLPDAFPRWERGGALEDAPIEAARALALYLEEEFGEDSMLGRFFRRIANYLEDFVPTPEHAERLVERVDTIRRRLFDGEIPVDRNQRRLLREVDLLVRLLVIVKPAPQMT
ncbi:MAG: hypothetical protein PWP23_346 [Candidatus Sumerlaeota bacterium]|nr:hypothetical protein [Candidatus Sumerlaeota bacterium]